ncbi:hypothetical protein CspHIS471_0207570 [Cutaneotrichosporon sp. HIS471]|nr:hypothetical protein CspHIS471_0207570 [Cutaneotrichosporon sp. HIS471]
MPPLRHYDRLEMEYSDQGADGYLEELLYDSDDSDDSDDLEFMGSVPATNEPSRSPSLEPYRGDDVADRIRAARRRFFELPENFRPVGGPAPRMRIPDAPPIPRGGPPEQAEPGPAAWPARARRRPLLDEDDLDAPGASADTAIALDDSSDDNDPVPGEPAARGPRQVRVLSPNAFRNNMDVALDRSLDRAVRFERRARRQQEENRRLLENAADRLNRHVRSPQPEAGPAEPRGNRMGGAALRHGNAHYHFRPDRAPEVRYLDRNGNVRVREGLDPETGEDAPPLPPGLERLVGPIRGHPAILRNLLNGAFHLGIGGVGPAGRLDAGEILDNVKAEMPPTATDGFTLTWDIEDLAKDIEEKERRSVVVELDERGRIVPDKRKPRGQVYLACCACPEPLRVGNANRSPEDRVWSLRCGHLLDQRCYKQYSEPSDDPPPLDAPAPKRRRSGRFTRSTPARKSDHDYSGNMSPRRAHSASWSEKAALPLPSSSRRSARPLSVPARMKRRWPLLLCVAIFFMVAMSFRSSSGKSATLAHESTQDRVGKPGSAGGFEREAAPAAEEDVMANDDLFVQRLADTKERTPAEIEADEEAARKEKEKGAEGRRDKVRALVWWITRGGLFPDDYRIPSAGTLAKMLQSEWESLLADVEGTDEHVFLGEWVEDANFSQRVTVFSKTFCPFSKRAKDILDEYPIHPDPYIIELDQRDDMGIIQDLLLSLTGRRTVPNVMIHFESIGGADETQLLHSEGGLQRRLSISQPKFQDWTRDH